MSQVRIDVRCELVIRHPPGIAVSFEYIEYISKDTFRSVTVKCLRYSQVNKLFVYTMRVRESTSDQLLTGRDFCDDRLLELGLLERQISAALRIIFLHYPATYESLKVLCRFRAFFQRQSERIWLRHSRQPL